MRSGNDAGLHMNWREDNVQTDILSVEQIGSLTVNNGTGRTWQ